MNRGPGQELADSAVRAPDEPLALADVATHAGHVVKQPFINVEEKIDCFVGRRTKTPDPLSLVGSTKADSIAWRKAFDGVPIPRGVYRFKNLEDADEWMDRITARSQPQKDQTKI